MLFSVELMETNDDNIHNSSSSRGAVGTKGPSTSEVADLESSLKRLSTEGTNFYMDEEEAPGSNRCSAGDKTLNMMKLFELTNMAVTQQEKHFDTNDEDDDDNDLEEFLLDSFSEPSPQEQHLSGSKRSKLNYSMELPAEKVRRVTEENTHTKSQLGELEVRREEGQNSNLQALAAFEASYQGKNRDVFSHLSL